MIRERSAGGVVIRRFRGRPFLAAIATRGGATLGLPKGGLAPGESAAEAAQREVREETGLETRLVERLGEISYWYTRGGERVLKTVEFFLFSYRSGRISEHDDEVDWAEWIPLEDAARRLSHRGEREIAAGALSRVTESR